MSRKQRLQLRRRLPIENLLQPRTNNINTSIQPHHRCRRALQYIQQELQIRPDRVPRRADGSLLLVVDLQLVDRCRGRRVRAVAVHVGDVREAERVDVHLEEVVDGAHGGFADLPAALDGRGVGVALAGDVWSVEED